MGHLSLSRVEIDDAGETIHLRLSKAEAMAFVRAVAQADTRNGKRTRPAEERLRGMASSVAHLVKQSKKAPPTRIKRPPDSESNEIDMDHVVHGSPPYPVLCQKDAYAVFARLERKGMPTAEIAGRLFVHYRTVYRWRKQYRIRKENGKSWKS